jgi:hypothetical protein
MGEMVTQKLREYYDSNYDFKSYVDSYCIKHHISLDVALTHKEVKEAALYYKEVTK